MAKSFFFHNMLDPNNPLSADPTDSILDISTTNPSASTQNLLTSSMPSEAQFTQDFTADCPNGLEGLIEADMIYLKRSIDHSEFYSNLTNKYDILNGNGDRIFNAVKIPRFSANTMFEPQTNEQFFFTFREKWTSFNLSLLDQTGREVLIIFGRPGASVKISLHNREKILGEVRKKPVSTWFLLKKNFTNKIQKINFTVAISDKNIRNHDRLQTALVMVGHIKGECCRGDPQQDEGLECQIMQPDESTVIGTIRENWYHEKLKMFMPGLQVPKGMKVTWKAVLLGGIFIQEFVSNDI